MFGNKKSNIPPRPHPPMAEQILEDISNADEDDAVFQFVRKGEIQDENSLLPTNTNETEVIYKKIQSYLKTKDRLKDLDETLKLAHESLQGSDVEMQRLAEDIKRQAQEALIIDQICFYQICAMLLVCSRLHQPCAKMCFSNSATCHVCRSKLYKLAVMILRQ